MWVKFYLLLLSFWFSSHLHSIGWGPPTLEKAICFSRSTNSNVNLSQKHLDGHTQNDVRLNVWTPMSQSSWHIKLSITVGVNNDPDSRSPALAAGIPPCVPLSAQGIQRQVCSAPVVNSVGGTASLLCWGHLSITAWACGEDWMRERMGTHCVNCSAPQRWRLPLFYLLSYGLAAFALSVF